MADAPQVAYSDMPQGVYSAPAQSKQEARVYLDEADGKTRKPASILGLRKRNFWIIAAILLAVVSATIGGSVGGAVAVRNAG
jgi:hypothetical protein